jgi:uncharacterized protein YuzE
VARITIEELLRAAGRTPSGDVAATSALYVSFPAGENSGRAVVPSQKQTKTFEARNKTIVLDIDDEGYVVGLELV